MRLTMTKLINRDAFRTELYKMGCVDKFGKISTSITQLNISLERSTVDAEYVVRCKDCKHYWKNKPSNDAPVCLASPKDDAFCSEGERKEDD